MIETDIWMESNDRRVLTELVNVISCSFESAFRTLEPRILEK